MNKIKNMNLKELIEFASAQAEKIFRTTGELLPMYHAIKSNGEQIVIAQPSTDKDVAVALVKAMFELEDVETYVFMSEGWILEITADREGEVKQIEREGLQDHPDRREVISFSAENRNETLMARRYILRPEHGKAKLMPLEFDDMGDIAESRGRMVGLLQK